MSSAVVIYSLNSVFLNAGAGHLANGKNPRKREGTGATSPKLSRRNERKFEEDLDILIKKHKKVLDELAEE